MIAQTKAIQLPEPPTSYLPPPAAIWQLTPLGNTSPADAEVLTQTLFTQIGRSGWFQLIAREDMGKILAELKISLSDACDSTQCAVEYGRQLSARVMIIGCLGRVGETYSMTLRLVDVETGRTMAAVEERAKIGPDDLYNLIDLCGAELLDEYAASRYRELGLPPPARPVRILPRTSLVASGPSQAVAFLALQITPTNAVVTIDGEQSPGSGLVPVPTGKPVHIRIEADSCWPIESVYTFDPNETFQMVIHLRRKRSFLF